MLRLMSDADEYRGWAGRGARGVGGWTDWMNEHEWDCRLILHSCTRSSHHPSYRRGARTSHASEATVECARLYPDQADIQITKRKAR